MRQVVLDTETTGLDPKQGHRVIEIACVEIESRRLTRRHFHRYINPQRDIDEGALAVHGINREFLQDKPLFADIVDDFLEFITGAELIIHNAPFDVGFLNHELSMANKLPLATSCPRVCDTLKMAREAYPGKRNNLDALCERLAIDNAHRTLHGALLDAELLADVYLALTRGQESLIIEGLSTHGKPDAGINLTPRHRVLRVHRASEKELALHKDILGTIEADSGGRCIWSGDRTGRSQQGVPAVDPALT